VLLQLPIRVLPRDAHVGTYTDIGTPRISSVSAHKVDYSAVEVTSRRSSHQAFCLQSAGLWSAVLPRTSEEPPAVQRNRGQGRANTCTTVGGTEPIESAAGSSDCTTSTSQFSGSWVVLGFPCWSLIARVGDNPPFFVGNGGTFTVPSGRLFLGVDDETLFFGDNSGSWVVAVQSAAPPPSDLDPRVVA